MRICNDGSGNISWKGDTGDICGTLASWPH